MNEEIPKTIERIVAMGFMKNSSQVALAKVDDDYRLFIEILDLESTCREIINLKQDIYIDYGALSHANNPNLFLTFNSSFEKEHKSSIRKFQCLPGQYFYFNLVNYWRDKWSKWHLKIDFSGNTVEKCIDDLEEKYEYKHDRDLVFFDTRQFREVNLIKFFDDFFEADSFNYNRVCMGDSVDVFLSSDNKSLGVCYFCKDEEIPRGNFCVFNIQDCDIPELVFSLKVDTYGTDLKFSNDNSKIIYWRWEEQNNRAPLIQYVIMDIDEPAVLKEKRIDIQYNKHLSWLDYFLMDKLIVKLEYDKFRIHSTETKQNRIIPRDHFSPYCSNENTLVYLHNDQLEAIVFYEKYL